MDDENQHAYPEFSLTRGGPLFSFLRATRLVGTGKSEVLKPGVVLAAMTWVPMAASAIVHWAATSTVAPIVRDPAAHVRLLVAIPLSFAAEAILDERCAASFRHLVAGYARRSGAAAPIAASALRLRDSWLAEAFMLAISIAFGQLALWGVTSPSGSPHRLGIMQSLSPSFAWYAVVGLPLFEFLLLRSFYRWAIWSRMLVSFSRTELDLLPTHPDLAGGIATVSEPVQGFAVILLAGSAVVAATWGYRIAVEHIDVTAFTSSFVLLVAIAMAMAFGPLLCFCPRLVSARLAGLRQYSELGRRYTRLFHEKWIVGPNDESLLGHPDISGLADLGGSFEKLEAMRPVPFGPRLAIIVFAAAFAPMVPVLAMVKPIPELFGGLAGALIGGLPH